MDKVTCSVKTVCTPYIASGNSITRLIPSLLLLCMLFALANSLLYLIVAIDEAVMVATNACLCHYAGTRRYHAL